MRKLIVVVVLLTAAAFALTQEAPPAPSAPALPQRAPRAHARPAVALLPLQAPEVIGSRGSSYLGVDTRDITPELARELNLKEVRGVQVLMVDQDAPAGKAGLKEKDVILSFNGTPVESVEQLRRLLRETPAGRQVTLGISRNGQPLNLTATLAERRSLTRLYRDFDVHLPKIEIPPMPDIEIPSFTMMPMSRRSGLTVESLTPQLGEFFGCKDARGVLVRSVQQNSPAAAAGIRAGDVIVKVDSESIDGTSDFSRAMRRTGKHNVVLLRDKREVPVSLEIPDRTRGDADAQGIFPEDFGNFRQMRLEMARLQPELQRALREMESHVTERRLSLLELQRHMRERELEIQKAMQELGRCFDSERTD